MQKSDFNFSLPAELIAQKPLKSREQSRLLCMDRYSGAINHRHFYDLPDLLNEGDCLVLNDSRVLPARLYGRLETGGVVEIVLLSEVFEIVHNTYGIRQTYQRGLNPGFDGVSYVLWECLTKPGKKTKPGAKMIFGNGELTAKVRETSSNGTRLIEFNFRGDFLVILEKLGKMPLPPYIHEELEDAERYQTVYSKQLGSVAAPTAGLHFTKELLEQIKSKGIDIQYITLHVGLGTFRPVKTENIEDHDMHTEEFIISKETAAAVNRTKENGGRVIAVGTTSCRVLESCTDKSGTLHEKWGFTDIFIYPGYKFKCIDGLITNFHLPESTLIMLVSALAGRESTLNAYKEAIRERYRFYSFGDAMFIL